MKKILFAVSLIVPFSINASVIPTSKGFDPRIAGVEYNPFNVVVVKTQVGVNTLIQLEEGETINSNQSGIAMGDAQAWGFNVKGNNVFFKPTAKNPSTNLTIVSDLGRTYSFYLTSSKSPYYIINMDYEKVKSAKDYKNKSYPCSDNGNINVQYVMWGDETLAPSYMWDDGRFTCLKFSENLQLPVIYKVSADGDEAIVNYHLEEDTIVLHDISNEFRARLGGRVLGLKSELTQYAGFNKKATTIDAKRSLK